MSNSYIIELERLRADLQEILENKGFNFDGNATLATMIPKVAGIGNYDILAAMFANSNGYEIVDTEGKITTINSQLLRYTPKITKLVLPKVISISTAAAQGCTSLLEIEIDNAVTLSSDVFNGCTNLVSASLENCQTLGSYSFNSCTSLIHFHAPKLVSIYDACLRYSGLSEFTIPVTVTLFNGTDSLGGNPNMLRILDNSSVRIPTTAFRGDTNFKIIILTSQTLVALQGTSAFDNTPFQTGDITSESNFGTAYVPASLVSNYQSATNWVNLGSTKFVQIESNINDLRTSGVDFSNSFYANKKWENGALVYDATIGEEDLPSEVS